MQFTFNTFKIEILISNLILLGLLIIASYTDLKYRKIYNKVTLPSLLAGVILAATANFPAGLWSALGACALGFTIFYLMFIFGYMGGGDVKLVAAIGALTGYPLIVDAIFFGIVFGGVYAIILLIIKGKLWENLKNVLWFIWCLLLWRQMPRLDSKSSIKVPYGFCLAVGTATAIIIKHTHPALNSFFFGF